MYFYEFQIRFCHRDLNFESRKYLQVTSTAQVGSFPSPRPFAKKLIPGSKSSFAIDFLLDYS